MREGYPQKVLLVDEDELNAAVRRVAEAIRERHGEDIPVFAGIHTRGIPFAERVNAMLGRKTDSLGRIDITLYRDDLDNLGSIPSVRGSEFPFNIEGSRIILFDDVLFTGRTVRAAIDEIMDYGRPERIELAVLADRGQRELPIAPDYCGMRIATERDDYISVHFSETDGEDGIFKLV